MTTISFVELLLLNAARGAVVFSAAWIITAAMERSSAAARHWVWTVAFGVQLVLPLYSLALPRWRVPLLPAPTAVTSTTLVTQTPAITERLRPSAGAASSPAVAPSVSPPVRV